MPGTWQSGWVTGDTVTAAEYRKSMGAVFDTTLGGAAATIDTLATIPGGYAHLLVVYFLRGDTAAASTNVLMRLNNDAGANYVSQQLIGSAAAATASESLGATSGAAGDCPASTALANSFASGAIVLSRYATTASRKSWVGINANPTSTTTGTLGVRIMGGRYDGTLAAITRIMLFPAAGNFVADSRLTVYALGA